MKIIHMSDLHVGHENLGDKFRTIVKNLIFEKGDDAHDYVIIITGDLVDNAKDDEQFNEVKAELDNLTNTGFTCLVVPGNHDYGNGVHGNKKFVNEFKKIFFGNENLKYPKLDIIAKTAFVGLDSMAEELNWYDSLWAQGELGKTQLENLQDILNSNEVKNAKFRVLYLHHHVFDPIIFHQLKDSDKLKEIIERYIKSGNKIDALLYGHNHAGKVHNGKWGIPRCYDAGSATLKPRGFIESIFTAQSKSAVRIINLEKDCNSDYIIELCD
jgi:3',5'-cyclic AMP phosphodiesterase CpdA